MATSAIFTAGWRSNPHAIARAIAGISTFIESMTLTSRPGRRNRYVAVHGRAEADGEDPRAMLAFRTAG